MARECQEANASGLTMVAIGMNKAAEEFLILDERTREDMANGKFRDQRRGSFGPAAPRPAAAGPAGAPVTAGGTPAAGGTAASGGTAAAGGTAAVGGKVRQARQARSRAGARVPARTAVRQPWTRSQEKLALLYNEQGLRPAEIAGKLGVTSHLVTQIILAAKNRGKS